MLNIKTEMIPVITGSTGTISKLVQKISEQLTGKARNQGTTENNHIGRCTHTAEGTNVKVQNIQHGK
jgi:hypothetical protein